MNKTKIVVFDCPPEAQQALEEWARAHGWVVEIFDWPALEVDLIAFKETAKKAARELALSACKSRTKPIRFEPD